jgi:hypothetical protein
LPPEASSTAGVGGDESKELHFAKLW